MPVTFFSEMSANATTTFNVQSVLSYLGLSSDYSPSPADEPARFLAIHLRELSPDVLAPFSSLLTPQQRTVLPAIRNRRQKYASIIPKELSFDEARKRWPLLWGGRDRPGIEQGKEERVWVDREFLGGQRGQVGKLGRLLSEYEEEREAERFREARQENMAQRFAMQSLDEEVEEEEEDEDEDQSGPVVEEEETPDQLRINFERLIRERFIYGLLDVRFMKSAIVLHLRVKPYQRADYDAIDWDDRWDEINEQDSEERWFEEEEEEEGVLPTSGSMSLPELNPPSRMAV